MGAAYRLPSTTFRADHEDGLVRSRRRPRLNGVRRETVRAFATMLLPRLPPPRRTNASRSGCQLRRPCRRSSAAAAADGARLGAFTRWEGGGGASVRSSDSRIRRRGWRARKRPWRTAGAARGRRIHEVVALRRRERATRSRCCELAGAAVVAGRRTRRPVPRRAGCCDPRTRMGSPSSSAVISDLVRHRRARDSPTGFPSSSARYRRALHPPSTSTSKMPSSHLNYPEFIVRPW